MTDQFAFLKDLISAPGLSGYEDPVAKIIEDKWRPLVNEISRGKLGSLHGLRHGTGQAPRPSVMIATHMDGIGLMVTGITEGFLRITEVGGVDARVLPGTPVSVFSTGAGVPKVLPGMVAQPSATLVPQEERDGPVALGSLDNRASVAALTICLEELQSRPHNWDVWAVASSQEEVGALGAAGSAFELRPTIAIVVDVTWAKGPGTSDWNAFPLGKGPTIVMGPNIHPVLHGVMKELADTLEIPYALEYTPTHSGTDGWATQVAAQGIPTLVLGIPLRYMHTPVEVVSIKDIQRAGRLLAEFIGRLGPDFMTKMVWDK